MKIARNATTLAAALAALLLLTSSAKCCCSCAGTGTPGYWKNHPEAWPPPPEEDIQIRIGRTTYTKEACIEWMKEPTKGDKTLTMFPAYVAAVLNIRTGACCEKIMPVLDKAYSWLQHYPPGSKIKASSRPWKYGECLYRIMDKYNNGELCAPSRDDLE